MRFLLLSVCVFADRASMVDKMECYNVGGCSRLSRIEASGAIHSADIHSEVCLFGMQLSGHLKSCARARAKIYCTRSWDVHLSITLPQHFPFIKIFILSFLIVLRIVPSAHGILWWEDYSSIALGEICMLAMCFQLWKFSHAFEFGLNNAVRRCPVHFTCHVIRPSMS